MFVPRDGGRWATLAWFLPYGFYAEYEYDVRIRIMASHELSLVEQMSQAEGELLLVNIAPPLFRRKCFGFVEREEIKKIFAFCLYGQFAMSNRTKRFPYPKRLIINANAYPFDIAVFVYIKKNRRVV